MGESALRRSEVKIVLSRNGVVAAGLAVLLAGAHACLGQATPPASQPAREGLRPTRLIELPENPTTATTAPAATASAAKLRGPRIGLSSHIWDFGRVWYGDPCKTEIQIVNGGDETLKILEIKSSCGCTIAKPKKRELAPGETDTMTVTYNTRKNKKKVSQRITIKTNDPKQPAAVLQIKGEVWNVFDGKPYLRLYMGQLLTETGASGSIDLVNNMEEPVFPKLRTLPDGARFEVKLEEIEPGQKYRLSAKTRPPLKLGSNSIQVVLETGVERLPTISIPVSALAMERVSAMPTRLPVYQAQSKPATRMVRVNFIPDQPIKITEVKSNHPAIKATVQQQPANSTSKSIFKYYTVRVAMPAWKDIPDEGASIEIYTDDPDPKFQKLVVPIEKRNPRSNVKVRPAGQSTPNVKRLSKP